MEKVADIYQTTDYSQFKRLGGNRKVEEPRVTMIIKSIEKVGYILNPIIVNERLEVVDGQGRLEACKRLGLPVIYAIAEGAGGDECIAMNINQSNWKITDYIDYYSELGEESYKRLQRLTAKYGGALGISTLISIAQGKNTSSFNDVKEGRFSLDEDAYKQAVECMEYLKDVSPNFQGPTSGNRYYYCALGFCFWFQGVDNRVMAEKLQRYRIELVAVSKMDQALDVIEAIYNKRAKKKVYIKTEYKKTMEEKYCWYSNKYLKT